MDETAQNPQPQASLSGTVLGPSESDPNGQVALGGISIDIIPKSKGGQGKSTTSGAGGGFSFDSIFPGKYEVLAVDPSGKYSRPPLQLGISGGVDNYPIYMGFGAIGGEKLRGGSFGGGWSLHGIVKDEERKPLSGIEVNIKSVSIDRPGAVGRIASAAIRLISRGPKEEKGINLDVKSNPIGMFFAGRPIPDGTYVVNCHDPSGKYHFYPQRVIIKRHAYPVLIFVGYSGEISDEKRKEIEEELQKYARTEDGKEVLFTEKTKHEAPEMNEEEASKRLAEVIASTQKNDDDSFVVPDPHVQKGERSGPREIIEPADESKPAERAPSTGLRSVSTETPEDRVWSRDESARFAEHEKAWREAEESAARAQKNIEPVAVGPATPFPHSSPYGGRQNSSFERPHGTSTRTPQPKRRKRGIPPDPSLGQAAQLTQQAISTLVKSGPWGWVVAGVIVFIIIFVIFFGGGGSPLSLGGGGSSGSGNSPAGGGGSGTKGGPVCSGTGSLDYSIPLRDASALPENLEQTKQDILNQFPGAQIQNADTIVAWAEQNGWNPSFLLTLWVEESGGQSGVSKADGNPNGYTDALGCDPSHPTSDISKSLQCIYDSYNSVYTKNEDFENLMCVYGGDGFHRAPCEFVNENPKFPVSFRSVYSKISPGTIQSVSCGPVQGGDWPVSGYLTQGPQGPLDHARLSTYGWNSVDIANPGSPTVLSAFDGTVTAVHDCISDGDCSYGYRGFGNSVEVTSQGPNGSFVTTYGHLSQILTSLGATLKAGDSVGYMGTTGASTGIHLHYQFEGAEMAPPNIPEPISPLNCDWGPSTGEGTKCNPDYVAPGLSNPGV